MNTKIDKKETTPEEEKTETTDQKSPKEEEQADLFTLDTDSEMEGLVDSIESKERSMKSKK